MNFLIFRKFRAIVGGNLRVLLSGGAPLAPDCHNFCRTLLGINLLQGYGLTETAATACIPDGSDLSTERVGGPLQEVDIRLVDWQEGGYTVTDQQGPRGEVVIGGGHVAKEYFGMPDKTEEEFFTDNGKRWFRTGDIGQMMPNGTIKLIDRKKDLVKLQLGEYVSLGKVESLLKIHPAIENICVVADSNQSHTVALVVPALPYLQDLGIKVEFLLSFSFYYYLHRLASRPWAGRSCAGRGRWWQTVCRCSPDMARSRSKIITSFPINKYVRKDGTFL